MKNKCYLGGSVGMLLIAPKQSVQLVPNFKQFCPTIALLSNYGSRRFFLGLQDSVIVGYNRNHLTSLNNWLSSVARSVYSRWRRCWRASVDGWAASTFHSRCDGKGPTVTIIRVGSYIFGGYASVSWGK